MVEGFRSISIREELVRKIEKILKKKGYRSIADFVSEAVRLRLEELEPGKRKEAEKDDETSEAAKLLREVAAGRR